jgi:tRNA dimethylallyltransferase
LAISLAKKFNTVILSADSRQFYKEMAIGTAKPNLEEQDGIKHYFIDSHSIVNPLSAADFEKEALIILKQEFQTQEIIILVGGSGMFIDALCNGLDKIPHDDKVREELNEQLTKNGIESLLSELEELDPEFYSKVDKNNTVRIIRALEAIKLSGKSYTDLRKNSIKKRDFEIIRFVIDLPRELLYERINNRAKNMFDAGLLDEVKNLSEYKNLQTLNTVGYSEVFAFLNQEITLEKCLELVRQNTRRYAKRQLTWFRRNEKNNWLKSIETNHLFEEILTFLQK